jgi:circadian clock protein KaiC
VGLQHEAPKERVSTGVTALDAMLGGEGVYRGSSVLISGTAGTGKTSLAAHFTDACCRRGERCLYFAYEESQNQLVRNMHSIGIDFEPHFKKRLLQFIAARPTFAGLEVHLTVMHKQIKDYQPDLVVVDPISNLVDAGTVGEAGNMLLRLIDYLKMQRITAVFTNLTHGADVLEATNVGLSSIVDTWLLLRDIESGGERNRGLYVLKSRGMAHSNQIREFLLTNHGIELRDMYVGPEGVLTGSMRLAQEAREAAGALARRQAIERKERDLLRKRKAIDAQIAALEAEFDTVETELRQDIEQEHSREERLLLDQGEMARSRGGNNTSGKGNGRRLVRSTKSNPQGEKP